MREVACAARAPPKGPGGMDFHLLAGVKIEHLERPAGEGAVPHFLLFRAKRCASLFRIGA